jgi:hypothetical protein
MLHPSSAAKVIVLLALNLVRRFGALFDDCLSDLAGIA